jgi:hypothetical protein
MPSEELKTRIEHLVDTHSVRFGAWLYRRTNGRLLHLWHRRALILTATGRRSGLPRTVIVQVSTINRVVGNGRRTYVPFDVTQDPSACVTLAGRLA